MASRKTIPLLLLALVLTAGVRPAASEGRSTPAADGYPAEQAWSVALHMHGSMSEQFGSWEWHTGKAQEAGVDVVWWTDHDWRLTNFRHLRRYDFEGTFWDPDSGRWAEPDEANPGQLRFWVPDTSAVSLQTWLCDTLAVQGSRSLGLHHPGSPGPEFAPGRLAQTTSDVHNKWSLAKRVQLRFALFVEDLDPVDARFVLDVEMSDHPEGNHRLRYVVGSVDGEGPHSIPLPRNPGTWTTYTVDVTEDAVAHFSTGGADTIRAEDNSVALVHASVETRNGATATVFLDDYGIDPDPSMVGDPLLDRGREMAAYYEALYPPVRNFLGSEISRFKAQPHLNAFAPDHVLVDYDGHVWSDTLHYAIEQIHAQGGAVSLNHVFGPKFDYQYDPDETPEHQASRIRWSKRWLTNTRALGVDVLEVGYRRRGGMDLVHHLELWDALNANAVFLTGNGVTDSHGRGHWQLIGWGPYDGGLENTNNFVTWLHAEEPSEAGFVRAMKGGRAYFGDPYAWDGALDLRTVDGFRMGQVVVTDRDSHDLVVSVGDVPCDAEVRLVQAEIREPDGPTSYLDIEYLRDEILVPSVPCPDLADTVQIDTSLPSLVRIEVRDGSGGDLVYSNPLHFVREVPDAGVAPARIAVRREDVRLLLAESFRLTSVAGSPGQGELVLGGDEMPAGSGWLRLDPGALGPPSQVLGAEHWAVVGGIVEMSGFSGEGSTVTVRWGPVTGVPAGKTGPGLWLSGGRPNPFGAGTVVDYGLPRPGWVRLEVYDVSGRRVRVLDLGFREAGRRRVPWDGRDELGRETAAGIYHLRLEHDGEIVTRKLARLR